MRSVFIAALLGLLAAGFAHAPRNPGPRGLVVVAAKQDHTASVLNAADGALVARLPVGVGPHEVAISHDGRWAVVTNYGDQATAGNSLTVLDLRGPSVARTISLGEHRRPHGVAFLAGDHTLVVTSEASQAVLVVDFASGAVEAAIPTGQPASHMLTASADGRRAYTANIVAGTITEIDLENRRTGRTLAIAPMVEGIALSPDGTQLWVGSNQAHTVSIVDTERWEVVSTLPSPGMPYRIAFTPDGRRAVVTSPMAGVIRLFDVAGRKEIAALPAVVGSAASAGPVGVAISADGAHAYVTLQNTDQVAVVDLARAELVARLPTGGGPDGIAHAVPPH